jgi:hypothetical protein
MNKNNNPVFSIAVLLSVVSSAVCADVFPRAVSGNQEVTVAAVESLHLTPSRGVKAAYSDCRRNRVVWSGGVARRGPDRISPRPIRSRWQGDAANRIYCPGDNSFSQTRVADEPWVR